MDQGRLLILVTIIGVFISAYSLPPIVLAALFFLTPVYFLLSLLGSAREITGRLALITGLLAGPISYYLFPEFDLLATGLIGGTTLMTLYPFSGIK